MSLEILELVWNNIKNEIRFLIKSDRDTTFNFLYKILLNYENFSDVLTYILSYKLSNVVLSFNEMHTLIKESYNSDPNMILCAARDIYAIRCNDPVIDHYYIPILYFKGFHALQAYRISNWLWKKNRKSLALYFQSQISCIFNVDIHPAASIGSGVTFDHATGIVIGETSVIEDNVSILQFVTLGARGYKVGGNRHPKVRSGVMIGAGAIILGNIEIGCFSKVGAGSIVLDSVPEYVTVAGNPAKIIDSVIKSEGNT